MRAILPAFEVEHVKLAAGFDHAPNRTQGLPFFVRREVVEHKRRKYAIEPRLGIRKLVSKSLIELDGDPCALLCVWRGQEPWDRDRVQPLRHPDEAA